MNNISNSFGKLQYLDRFFAENEDLYLGDMEALGKDKRMKSVVICKKIMATSMDLLKEYQGVKKIDREKAVYIISALKRMEARLIDPQDWPVTDKVMSIFDTFINGKDESKKDTEFTRKEAYKVCKTTIEFFKSRMSNHAKKVNREANSRHFLQMVDQVSRDTQNPLSKEEKYFFERVSKHFPVSDELEIEYSLVEILKGAHVLIDDDGKLYDDLSKKEGAHISRVSSHYKEQKPKVQQYAIRGEITKEVLYGKMEKSGKTYTWFQLEANPVKGVSKQTFSHIFVDYVGYKMTGRNQGPYGESHHTEKYFPLVLE